MTGYIAIYKVLLRLYPASYRKQYEAEMVHLFTDLLAETSSPRQRFSLLLATVSETLRWATPEVATYAENNIAATPTFIKANTILSVVCVIPFLLASLYRLHMLYDHEAKPALLALIIHAQDWYAVILPILGLLIAGGTILWSLLYSERYWHVTWFSRLRSAWHNSLLVLCFIAFTALSILT